MCTSGEPSCVQLSDVSLPVPFFDYRNSGFLAIEGNHYAIRELIFPLSQPHETSPLWALASAAGCGILNLARDLKLL